MLAFVLFFSACNVDSEKGAAIIEDATQNTIDQIDVLLNSDFADAFGAIFFIEEFPFDDDSKSANVLDVNSINNLGTALTNSLTQKFPEIFNNKKPSEFEGIFDFAAYTGTYTWDDTTWVYEKTPADMIIINLPSPGSITNDLRIEWSEYEEVKIANSSSKEASYSYYPTRIMAEFFKDDSKIGNVDYTATWNTTFQYPMTIVAEVALLPIKFIVNYNFENSIAALDLKIKKGGRMLDHVNANVTFKNDSMKDVTTVAGEFKTYSTDASINTGVLLKVVFDVDIATIDALEDPTAAQINENATVELYTSSNRMFATVEAVENDDCAVQIVYTDDGTTENLCTYGERLIEAVEQLIITSGVLMFY